jgi:ketopantoate reductase
MSNIHDPNQIILLITQLVVKSVAEISPVDYIVCAHKAIDQDEVAALLQPAIDSRTTIVVIQNGVGNEEPFRKRFPDNSIITCVVRSLHIVNSGLVLTSTDVGRSHADKSWDCRAHQIRGYADRLIPQPQGRKPSRATTT